MTNPPPSLTSTTPNLLTTHRSLLDTLTSFLTVSIHHILSLRRLYPAASFHSVRAYNYPIRQSRHPNVCTWILDAVAAVRDQVERGTVESVSVCIFEMGRNQVLERWTVDLRSFPVVEKARREVPFAARVEDEDAGNGGSAGDAGAAATGGEDPLLRRKINVADLEAQFRGMLSRIATASAKLKPLPKEPECSFTITIEVKDDADRPVGRLDKLERAWVAAEPDVFDDDEGDDDDDDDNDTNDENSSDPAKTRRQQGKTTPVRRLEAGELRLEMWVEESQSKLDMAEKEAATQKTQEKHEQGLRDSQRSQEHPFSAENGYDLEPPDVNRKPQGGAFTDYRR